MEQSANPLQVALDRLEHHESLDTHARRLDRVATAVASGPRQSLLRGDWLGHALHPLLTDFPLGCWLAAGLLDMFGGHSSRRAAQRLVGAGLLLTPPTIASGLAEYRELESPRTRRVAVVHAIGNAVVATLYLLSWRARRQGQHARGVFMGTLGGLCAAATGYLGGHLSFARGAGVRADQTIDLTATEEVDRPADGSDLSRNQTYVSDF
jgi:uncharacterized membrane protein